MTSPLPPRVLPLLPAVAEISDLRLIEQLENRVRDVAKRAGPVEEKPSVLCLEWLDPPTAAGDWAPELVAIAGGRHLLGQAGHPAKRVSWDEINAADPDVIIFVPRGFTLERVRAEAASILPLPQVRTLRAVRDHRVYLVDGDLFINRPDPGLVDSLEILAEIIHPDLFAYGHPGWTTL